MRRRLPRTPFSTPFSPSKKMVEARIRGVIAGPQKRPPLLLLLLVLAFCFFSVNLVSCQPSQKGTAPLMSFALADGGEVYLLEEKPRNDQEPLSDTVAAIYYRPAGGVPQDLGALDYGPDHHYWLTVSLETFTDVLGSDGFILNYQTGTIWNNHYYYSVEDGQADLMAACYNKVWQEDLDNDGELELLNNYDAVMGYLDVYDRSGGLVTRTRLNDYVRHVGFTVVPDDAWVSLSQDPETGALVASWREDGQEVKRKIDDPAKLYYIARKSAPYPYTDLNRNGSLEVILTDVDIDAGRHDLTILENGESIYSITLYSEDSMRTSVFLYRDEEGQDWLLAYVTMLFPDDHGDYYYQVFRVDGSSTEEVFHKRLTFDLRFSGDMYGHNAFDPEAIAAYVDEVNALLKDSTLLLCADPNLKSTFNRKGRLEDDLWWIELDYVRDPDKSLVETLREYQAVKEAAVSNRPAVPYLPAPGTPERQAALEAYRAVLEGEATFYSTDIGRNVDMPHIGEVLGLTFADHLPAQFTLVDLDGDGVEELALYYQLGNGGTIVMFHYQDGEVLGYYKFGRGFQSAKTDGIYTGSGGAFTRYLLRITSFDRSGFEEEITAYYDYHDPNTFMLHDQPSTEKKVTDLFYQHDAKEDVTWYDLTGENIRAVFP